MCNVSNIKQLTKNKQHKLCSPKEQPLLFLLVHIILCLLIKGNVMIKKSFKLLYVSFIFLILLTTAALAENFSGTWFMNANGWTFNLELKQFGSYITGTMRAINSNNPDSTIEGRVSGNKIIFYRKNPELKIPQEYEGFLFSRGGGQAMAGKFSHANQWKYGWYAIRK